MALARRHRGTSGEGSPRSFFLVFALGGGLVLALLKLVWDHWFPPVVLSAILIVAYGLLLWDRESKRPKFDHAGDNLYYVGFLYTLISLAVSLYLFTGDGYTEDIVRGFGVALSSTVLGLIGRVVVNQSPEGEAALVEAHARGALVSAHRELRAQMDYAIEDYKRFRQDLGELEESVDAARLAAADKRQQLETETARLGDLHGVGSRLEKAAEEAMGRIGEQQGALVSKLEEVALAVYGGIAAQQEDWIASLADAQRDALERAAARHDESVSRLERAAGAMAQTIAAQRQAFDSEASAVREAIKDSLEGFRGVDFGREVEERVVEPAAAQLRQLIGGFEPLVESLSNAQDEQQRAAQSNRQVLQDLAEILAQNRAMATGYERSAQSLARAADALDSLPVQFERQTARTEETLGRIDAMGERVQDISGALNRASAFASRLESKPRSGFLARLRGRS